MLNPLMMCPTYCDDYSFLDSSTSPRGHVSVVKHGVLAIFLDKNGRYPPAIKHGKWDRMSTPDLGGSAILVADYHYLRDTIHIK